MSGSYLGARLLSARPRSLGSKTGSFFFARRHRPHRAVFGHSDLQLLMSIRAVLPPKPSLIFNLFLGTREDLPATLVKY